MAWLSWRAVGSWPATPGADGYWCWRERAATVAVAWSARRLHDWGAEVRVRTTAPADRFTEVSRHQLAILERLNVPLDVVDNEEEAPADVIVDALYRIQPAGLP